MNWSAVATTAMPNGYTVDYTTTNNKIYNDRDELLKHDLASHVGLNQTANDVVVNATSSSEIDSLEMLNSTSTFAAFQAAIHYDAIYQTVLVLGICGNLINLVVLTRPSLRGVTFVYLTWLALSDLLYLVVNSPVHVVTWLGDPMLLFNYYVMFGVCRLTFALSNTFSATSAFLVTVLTIDRHQAICYPLKCKDNLSRRYASLTIALSYALAIAIYLPVVFQTRLEPFEANGTDQPPVTHGGANGTTLNVTRTLMYSCQLNPITDRPAFKLYVAIREVVSRVMPIVVVALLNVRIIFALRKHSRERRNLACSSNKDRAAEERRLVYLLIAIVVLFVTCTTPQMISWCIVSQHSLAKSDLFNIFDSIAELLVAINAAANFYLYCFCSAAVRRTLHQLLMQWCLCRTVLVRFRCLPRSINLTGSSSIDNSMRSTQHSSTHEC